MYHVSAQGVDERMINVHYYYYCNHSRKKSRESAASLPGRFLSRRCFTPCTTMEAEPITAK